MSFDESKVQFSAEELAIGGAADSLYELFADAMDDGFDLSDLAAIPAAVPHIMAMYGWLAEGTKAEYAKKLIALGVMLLRDNEWLDGLDNVE
jgi:hypothetical protein